MYVDTLRNLYKSFIGSYEFNSILKKLPVWVRLFMIVTPLFTSLIMNTYSLVIALTSLITIALISKCALSIINLVRGLKFLIIVMYVSITLIYVYEGQPYYLAMFNALVPIARLVILTGVFIILSRVISTKEVLDMLKAVKAPKGLAYAFLLTLRFIPLILHDLVNVTDSLRLKGVNRYGSRLKRIMSLRYYLTPLLVVSMERVEKVTEALELRGLLESD